MKTKERKSWAGLIEAILGDCLPDQTVNDLLANSMLASIKKCAKARRDRAAANRESAALYRNWLAAMKAKNGIAARWELFLAVLSEGGFSDAELSELRADVAHLAFEAHLRGERIATHTRIPAFRVAAAA
jgi:hypothetical protein